MSESESQESIDLARLKAAVATLAEHFDTVMVFVTRENDSQDEGGSGTVNAQFGVGNWFARKGQVQNWCLKQDEFTRLEARRDSESDR